MDAKSPENQSQNSDSNNPDKKEDQKISIKQIGTENKFPGLTQTSFNQSKNLIKDRKMTEDINQKQVTFALDNGSGQRENKDDGNAMEAEDDKSLVAKTYVDELIDKAGKFECKTPEPK